MPCRTRGARPAPRRSVLPARPAPSPLLLPSGPSQEENTCPKDLAAGTHAQTPGGPVLARLQAPTPPGARVGVRCPRGGPVVDPPPGLWLHGVRLPTRGETATVSRLARQDEGATKGPRRRYGSGTRRASRRSSPGWVTRFPGRRVPRGRPSACSRESPRRLSWGFRVLIF